MYKPSKADELLLGRIDWAKQDRHQFQHYINECYEYGMPQRQRMGDRHHQARDPEEQSDLFDTTFGEAIEDYASEQIDMLMPYYREWVEWKAKQTIPDELKGEVKRLSETRREGLFDVIQTSNLSGALPETWRDAAVSAAGLFIHKTPAGLPINCEPVLASELLIEPGPYGGIDGRWRNWFCPIRFLKTLYGKLPHIDEIIREKKAGSKNDPRVTVEVTEGYHRDWDADKETWVHSITVDGKVLKQEKEVGRGACGLLVLRSAVSHPSAWGPGPAMRALPAARALNVMAYLELKAAGKVVDPPFSYLHTSVSNVEQGMEAGYGYPVLQKDAITFYPPGTDLSFSTMTSEQLRSVIRSAMYLDEPEQEGLTPPTLGQWMREEARHARRVTLPRDIQVQEFVLPTVHRFEWLAERRGEIQPIEAGDKVFQLWPISPLSSARDLEEASKAYELVMQMNQMFPSTASLMVDGYETALKMKELRGDKVVELRKPEDASPAEQEVLTNASGGTRVNNASKIQ